MLPGLTRTAAHPASIAANTYFGWKWMSAITGICDFWAISGQRVGVVLARHGDADDVAAGGRQLGDLLQGRVDVGGEGRRHRLHADRRVALRPAPCRPGSCGWRRRGPRTGGGRAGIPSETLIGKALRVCALSGGRWGVSREERDHGPVGSPAEAHRTDEVGVHQQTAHHDEQDAHGVDQGKGPDGVDRPRVGTARRRLAVRAGPPTAPRRRGRRPAAAAESG